MASAARCGCGVTTQAPLASCRRRWRRSGGAQDGNHLEFELSRDVDSVVAVLDGAARAGRGHYRCSHRSRRSRRRLYRTDAGAAPDEHRRFSHAVHKEVLRFYRVWLQTIIARGDVVLFCCLGHALSGARGVNIDNDRALRAQRIEHRHDRIDVAR